MLLVFLLLVCSYYDEAKAFHKISLSTSEVKENVMVLKNIVKSARGSNQSKYSKMLSVDLTSFKKVQYFGTVFVGSPRQRFEVLFDTASDIFWIPGQNDTSTCGVNHHKFIPSKSVTYRDLHQTINNHYLKGDNVLSMATETMTAGEVTINKQTVGLTVNGECQGHQFDGILGMSFRNPERPDLTPVFETMINQKAVASPVFSFYLNRKTKGKGGELYLGGWNPAYTAKQQIKYIPLAEGSTVNWEINMKSVYIGTKMVAAYPRGILDTGTSLIIGPRAQVQQIAAALGGRIIADIIAVECSKIEYLPSLTFNIDDVDYTLTSWNLLLYEEDGLCMLGIGRFPDDKGVGENAWLLGDTFLGTVYSIHDYANRKVALVPLRHNPGSTEEPLPPLTTQYPSNSNRISSSPQLYLLLAPVYIILCYL